MNPANKISEVGFERWYLAKARLCITCLLSLAITITCRTVLLVPWHLSSASRRPALPLLDEGLVINTTRRR